MKASTIARALAVGAAAPLLAGCNPSAQGEPPARGAEGSVSNPCAEPLLICPSEMTHFQATPDELLHIVEGRAHGFESLSLVYTETKPGGGAPPHHHRVEEAHIVLDGRVEEIDP